MAFPHCINIVVIFFLLFNLCYCRSIFVNQTIDGFAPATATWYGPPNGHGTDSGACGFGNVGNPPYNSFVAAGNQALYKGGKGCGQCYQVKCTDNPACSGNSITIRITDLCTTCNEPVWFDLGGLAFGSMAKPGKADAMRTAGKVKIWYQSGGC